MGHPPTTTHRYAPDTGSIAVHIFMCYTTVLVFHKRHPNDFCRPPPLRTVMGHRPTTTHRYAPGTGSIAVHIFM
jgi:hypothetical protein